MPENRCMDTGLKLICVGTRAETGAGDWSAVAELLNRFTGKARFVSMMDHRSDLGELENGIFVFYDNEKLEPNYVQSLRVFDRDQELYIWRTAPEHFNYRYRVDGEGETVDVVETSHLLWGRIVKYENRWASLAEERGIKLRIPVADANIGERLWLKTRNYITYNELGQAGYVDCRFLGVVDEKGMER